MAEFRFEQCADGLMDCSVWRWQSDLKITDEPKSGGGVLRSVYMGQVWRPAQFGPETRERSEIIDWMMERVASWRAERSDVRA